jgi:hypothetical protein
MSQQIVNKFLRSLRNCLAGAGDGLGCHRGGGRTERDAATGAGDAALHGTVTLRDGATSAPGVLMLAGSGPVDRNGNLPGLPNDSLKLLAHELVTRGVTSLRVDKRGIDVRRAAGPREEDLRFDAYVSDAIAWLRVIGSWGLCCRAATINRRQKVPMTRIAPRCRR